MPPSFINSRADALIDVVVLLTILSVPILYYAIALVRRGEIESHKRVQLFLTFVFIVATLALEIDLRLQGGMAHFVKGGAYENTLFLNVILYGHLAVAFVNALLWIALPLLSWRRFHQKELPGPFSKTHRKWGKLAALFCVLTALSGVALYLFGFVL